MDNHWRMHPFVDNRHRDHVMDWCVVKFGPQDDRWHITSNYDFSKDGEFDVVFSREEDAIEFKRCFTNAVRISNDDKRLTYEEANPQLAFFSW